MVLRLQRNCTMLDTQYRADEWSERYFGACNDCCAVYTFLSISLCAEQELPTSQENNILRSPFIIPPLSGFG